MIMKIKGPNDCEAKGRNLMIIKIKGPNDCEDKGT